MSHSHGVYAISSTLWRADRYGRRIERLPVEVPVQGAITHNEDTEVKRKLSLQVNDPDRLRPYRDYLIPEITLADTHGTITTRTKGHFMVTEPKTTLTPGRYSGTIEAVDICTVLASAQFAAVEVIPAGTDKGAAARDIALGAGLMPTQMDLPDVGDVLLEDKELDPGTTRLKAINDLYNSAGWYTVWSDDFGVIRTGRWQELAAARPSKTLAARRADGIPLSGPISGDPEAGRLRNQVTVRNLRPDEEPIYWTARVTNPDHPLYHDPADPEGTFPMVLAGDPVDDANIETVAAARVRAEQLLDEGASIYRRATVKSVIDLDADVHEVVQLRTNHPDGDFDGRWWRRTWSISLHGASGLITSELYRVQAWR